MTAPKESRCFTIEGDLVRLQRTVVEREVRTTDFVRELTRVQPLSTGSLPTGCAWFTRRENNSGRVISVYVIERPAGIQPVRFKKDSRADDPDEEDEEVVDETVHELTLSWPHTLWFVRCDGEAIQDVHLTAAHQPMVEHGGKTALFVLPMPNQYEYGQKAVCLGNLAVADGEPLAQRINCLISQVLSSLWNADRMPRYDGTGVDDLLDWSAKSAADPEHWRKMTFANHHNPTVEAMLIELLGASESTPETS